MSGQNNASRNSQKTETFIVLLLMVLILSVLYQFKFTVLGFKPITESNVLAVVTLLFVVAVFMERSVEAILIPIRTPDRQKIEQELVLIRNRPDEDAEKITDQHAKEQELDIYKLGTAKRAYWISFIFGLAISLAGVRTLGEFVNPDALKALSLAQSNVFHCADIFLTGGLIAGGSAAIDKIGRAISTHFNLKSAASAKT